jgi:hypothetical protein
MCGRAVLLRVAELAMEWEIADHDKIIATLEALLKWLKVCFG